MIQQQTSKKATWTNESGEAVPFKYVPAVARLKEKNAFALYTSALKAHNALKAAKADFEKLCKEVFDAQMSEKEQAKIRKGNFTFYNFDYSIKIEVNIDERIEFDSVLIEKCKQELLSLVESGISQDKVVLKKLILSAFQTVNGRLDTKKILPLRRYTSEIKDARYQRAMEHLDAAIRRPFSKKYFQISVRNDAGEYENIGLNFSSI